MDTLNLSTDAQHLELKLTSYSGGAAKCNLLGLPGELSFHLDQDAGGSQRLVTYVIGSVKDVTNTNLTRRFEGALASLRNGFKVTRLNEFWQSQYRYLYIVPGSQFKVSRPPLLGLFPEGHEINYNTHIDCVMFDGTCGTYNITNEDVMAEDWAIITSADEQV